jgi:hypothetical protein
MCKQSRARHTLCWSCTPRIFLCQIWQPSEIHISWRTNLLFCRVQHSLMAVLCFGSCSCWNLWFSCQITG